MKTDKMHSVQKKDKAFVRLHNKVGICTALLLVNARNRRGSYSDLIFSGFTISLRLCLFAAMFRVAYGSSSSAGYISAVWSVSIAQTIFALDRPDPTLSIGDDIKEGSIAIHLLRPLNYVQYSVASFWGRSIPGLISGFGFSFVTALLLTHTLPETSVNFLLGSITMAGGIIVITFIAVFFGLCGFWTEDTHGFQYLSHKMALLFGGLIIPLAILPDAVHNVVSWTPWTVGLGRPGSVMTHFSYPELGETLLLQVGYIVILYCACVFMMNRGIKKLNVTGG